ncbi:hypothetical protein [Kitasatospora sp. NPDC001095]
MEFGPDPVAKWIIRACGWENLATVQMGQLPSQRRIVQKPDNWWIGIEASAPYKRVRMWAGRVNTDGTYADWTSALDEPVDATDARALVSAVTELRKRLDSTAA